MRIIVLSFLALQLFSLIPIESSRASYFEEKPGLPGGVFQHIPLAHPFHRRPSDLGIEEYLNRCIEKKAHTNREVRHYMAPSVSGRFAARVIDYHLSVVKGADHNIGHLDSISPGGTGSWIRLQAGIKVFFKLADQIISARHFRQIARGVQAYFFQYGIFLDLGIRFEFDSPSFLTRWFDYNWVYLHDNYERMNANNIAFAYPNRQFTNFELASAFVHEFGHRLGLPDEYEEISVEPERWVGEPDSIMRAAWNPTSKFYPRHIQWILGPLCGKRPKTITWRKGD